MYSHHLYIIENYTNMHVGSGNANFDIIDNQIQRDAITHYPVIHSSSLKGAIKEYCKYRHDEVDAENFIKHIFGDEEQSGKIRFVDAYFLSIPMRSNTKPYYVCTSPKAISEFIEYAEEFNINIEDIKELKKFAQYSGDDAIIAKNEAIIETVKAKQNSKFNFRVLEKYVGSPAALIPNKKFDEFLKDLPVIARNQLENGESQNLWYEEVLPRKSRLWTIISEPTHLHRENRKLANHFKRFQSYLTDNQMIQIGANASIGYGLCKFIDINGESQNA